MFFMLNNLQSDSNNLAQRLVGNVTVNVVVTKLKPDPVFGRLLGQLINIIMHILALRKSQNVLFSDHIF